VATEPAAGFAAAQLERRFRKVRRIGDALDGTPEQRHALRIASKKLRYAAECFAPLFPAKRVKAFTNALAGMQDVLGSANDATVASAIAERLMGAGSPAAALVAGWASARASADAKALARAWRRFRKTGAFWD
jgi:CHAD domain-containing protein